jgi:predicted ATP-dependent serine protease
MSLLHEVIVMSLPLHVRKTGNITRSTVIEHFFSKKNHFNGSRQRQSVTMQDEGEMVISFPFLTNMK